MPEAVPPFVRHRTHWLLLLVLWTAAVAWSAPAQPSWMHGLLYLLPTGVIWGLLEQLRRQWLALEAARQALLEGEKMAALGRMVAGFSHEINTPIGVAVGAITHSEQTLAAIDRLIDSEEVNEQELRAALATLKQGDELAMANLRRAAALVQSFKRTSIDQASGQARVFVVRELIDDVLHGLHNQFKRLPITLAVNCQNDLKIDGVPGLLEQVLTNLLINSIKHGFEQGKLAGNISISAQKNGRNLALTYTDDGAGMLPEVLERLFEPFFTTRRDDGGSGLGMTVCYNIVTANLGGTIDCQSKPGAGVKFLIEFPAQFVE